MINLIVTDVQKQKNNPKRYSIFIDGQFAFGLDEIDVLYYKLFDCKEISEEKVEFIKNNIVFQKARDTAIKFLSFKQRTRKEIIVKLREKEYTDDIIAKVIRLLQKYSYIDDYAYASAFFFYMFNLNGLGVSRIRFELKQKGVSDEIIEKVVMENSVDETERAVSLVERKYGVYDYDIKEKRRIEGFLARKGFSFSVIKEAFQILKERDF